MTKKDTFYLIIMHTFVNERNLSVSRETNPINTIFKIILFLTSKLFP